MAHSHSRTMLASFGFSDPDKKEPRHDLACRYVSQPDVLARILQIFQGRINPIEYHLEHHLTKGEGQYKTTIGFLDGYFEGWLGIKTFPCRSAPPGCPDPPVTKGLENRNTDEYRKYEDLLKRWIEAYQSSPLDEEATLWLRKSFIVEVKIKPVPVGDIMRQLALYETYLTPQRSSSPRYTITAPLWTPELEHRVRDAGGEGLPRGHATIDRVPREWARAPVKILVVGYDLSVEAKEALGTKNIHVVRLGPDFDAYCKRSEDSVAELATV